MNSGQRRAFVLRRVVLKIEKKLTFAVRFNAGLNPEIHVISFVEKVPENFFSAHSVSPEKALRFRAETREAEKD